MVDISLLPKKPEEAEAPDKEKPQEVKTKGNFPTGFLVAGIIVIIVTALITSGIFVYKSIQNKKLEDLNKDIAALHENENQYKPMEKDATALQNQLNSLQNLLNKHKYWSVVMTTLADYTPVDVSYKNITCETNSNKFTVTGYASSYNSLAQLMFTLKQKLNGKEYFDNVTLESAKLGQDDNKQTKVIFSIDFNLKPGSLIKIPETTKKNEQTTSNIIVITKNSFSPAQLNVKAGTTVVFKNNDTATQSINSDAFTAAKIEAGGKYQYQFNNKGTYIYYSSANPNVKGKIVVE